MTMGGIGGRILGVLAFKGDGENFYKVFCQAFDSLYRKLSPYGFATFYVSIPLLVLFHYRSYAKRYRQINPKADFEEVEEIERHFFYDLWILDVFLIVSTFFWIFNFMMGIFSEMRGDKVFITLFSFLWGIILSQVVMRKLVLGLRKFHPEKKADPFQGKFEKAWLESCDEQEQAQTYKIGFFAFRRGRQITYLMLIACLFLKDILQRNISTLIFVTLILLVQVMFYHDYCWKEQ